MKGATALAGLLPVLAGLLPALAGLLPVLAGPLLALAGLLLALPALAAEPGRITYYCGGGFTGGGGGIVAEADGRLLLATRRTAAAPLEEEELAGRTAPVARWHALLDAAGFERMPPGRPSNMTCSLARQRGDQTHSLRWPGLDLPATLPPAVRQVVTEMREAARR